MYHVSNRSLEYTKVTAVSGEPKEILFLNEGPIRACLRHVLGARQPQSSLLLCSFSSLGYLG